MDYYRPCLDKLVEVYKRAYKEYPEYAEDDPYRYLEELLQGNKIFFQHYNGEIAGFILIGLKNGIGAMQEFVVDSRFHGCGVGRELFNQGLNYLSSVNKITLEVGRYNIPAYNLYRKYGFKPVYTEGKWITMQLDNIKVA